MLSKMLHCVDNNGLLYVFMLLASLKYSWVQTRERPRVTLLLHSGHRQSRGWQSCFSSRAPWFSSGQGAEISIQACSLLSPRDHDHMFSVTMAGKDAISSHIVVDNIACVSALHLFSLSSLLLSVGCFAVLVIEPRAADIAGVWLSSKILFFLQLSLQAWSPITESLYTYMIF